MGEDRGGRHCLLLLDESGMLVHITTEGTNMEQLQKLEAPIEKLVQKLPPLSKDGKAMVAGVLPWVALIFGALELFLVWGLYDFLRRFTSIDSYFSNFGIDLSLGLTSFEKFMIYLGMLVLVASAVVSLLAVTPLRARRLYGWRLLFLAALINLAYAVLSLFIAGQGIGSLIVSLLQSALSLYILFQVREVYADDKNSKSSKNSTTTKIKK